MGHFFWNSWEEAYKLHVEMEIASFDLFQQSFVVMKTIISLSAEHW